MDLRLRNKRTHTDDTPPLTTKKMKSAAPASDDVTISLDAAVAVGSIDNKFAVNITPIHSSNNCSSPSTLDVPPQVSTSAVQLVANKFSVPGNKVVSSAPEEPIFTLSQWDGVNNPGYIPDHTLKRIALAASRAYPEINKHPLSTAVRGDWGRSPGESKVLYFSNQPVIGTVVGRITTTYFYTRNGAPVDRVNIGVKPLRPEDQIAYNELMNTKCYPIMKNQHHGTIYSARFQSEQRRGDPARVVLPFAGVWDARTIYGPKNTIMKQLDPSYLAVNDIVLLEFTITRYKPKTADSGYRSNNSWDKWAVSLDLRDIIMFYEAPRDVVISEDTNNLASISDNSYQED
ncbi:hypothetical protein PHLCEN_2v6782, partial [Hermanssonia centrifuga]